MPNEIVIDENNLNEPDILLGDIVVHDGPPSKEEVIEAHDHDPENHVHGDEIVLTIGGDEENSKIPPGADVVITDGCEPIVAIDFIGDLPGAPHSPDPHDEEDEDEEDEDAENDGEDSSDAKDSKTSKPQDKWDWKPLGLENFVVWVKDRFSDIPSHSGYDHSGIERAVSYLEKLHKEVSGAMRSDVNGVLDANEIADVHQKIEEGIEKLIERAEKIKRSKRKTKKSSADESQEDLIVKEAQKVFGVQNGVVITVPIFISSLARALVNGTVSAGHDLEHSYDVVVKKWKLTDREKMELIQLLQDMGMPMIRDRSLLPEDGLDPSSSDNIDFSSNYQA